MIIREQNTEHRTQTKKYRKTLFPLIGILFSVFCILYSCSPAKERGSKVYKETRTSIYTIVTITVSSDSETKAQKAIGAAFKEIERISKLLNFYSEDSEVSLINRHAGERPVKVSSETLEIVSKALYTAENTDGGFDITVGHVVKLWDFQNKIMPDKNVIKEKLKATGYKNIVLDREQSTVFLKKKGMQIDLGGIIKGYIADKVADVLKKNGIKAGIVSAAGDIKTFGTKPDGSLWKVGIKNPRQKGDNNEIIAVVDLSDMAISTSGDYEKFFIKDGIRYHHILNPETGYPASECQSVTVITRDAVFTDAFSTGIFVLGPKKGMEVLTRLGLDGIIVDKDGRISITEGIKEKIKWSIGVLE